MQYVLITVLSVLFGQVIKHLCKKLPPVVSEEITYKEFRKTLFKDFKIDFKYTIICLISFFSLIIFLGSSLNTYLFIFLIPALLVVFSIDYRFCLIPDEAHIYIVILAIINLIFNLNLLHSYLLGALIGAGIFWGLGALALLILKKEGMGFGDVKLMGALGLLFGMKNILIITLVAFLIGAIVGGLLLIFRKKDTDSYIPFGPFIVIGTVIIMFVPADEIIKIYIDFCTGLGRFVTDIIYSIIS
ncbi:MAG: A24 family peptidase [Clostridia bacterium]|nr:A24 family peptidase [Clostridia bacterium]